MNNNFYIGIEYNSRIFSGYKMERENYVIIDEDDADMVSTIGIIPSNNPILKNINNDIELINENNRNNNVYNHLLNKKHDSYNNLINYIKPFEKLKSDISFKKPNICDVYLKKAYDIPDNKIEFFMTLLNECSKDKYLRLNFTELQLSDKKKQIGSGLMYDFDILQDDKISKLEEFGFTNLISEILSIINNVLDLNPTNINKIKVNHYACIIKKKSIEFKENENKYKDGFHILIPSIKTVKEVKKYIYNKIINSDRIKTLFEDIGINDKLENIIDKGSYSVPVHFINNCKVNKEPYIVFKTFKILYTHFGFQIPENADGLLIKPSINLCYEFSLNYENSNGYIKKYYYEPQTKIEEEIEYYESNQDNNEEFLDKNINDISILSLHNPNTKFIRELLYLLSPERSADRNLWRDVIYALVNESPNLKPLAIEFSKRNSKKWDPIGFERLWNEAISNTTENRITLRSLIYWAKIDSPNEYEKVINRDIKQIIKSDICASILHGNLYHYQFAKYLQYMFSEKFITDEVGGKTIWYEFVIENDKYIKGQVYKWREEPRPDNLYIYVSAILPNIMSEIIQDTDDYIKTIKDNDELLEYLIKLKNNIINSTKKLYDTGFKTKLIKEAEVLFRKRGFAKSLNKDQDIMGVGNGVLVLSESPYLINTYHNYPITIYSDVFYKPYDEQNPNIQKFHSIMKGLFPENELDVYEYLLYYFASCLDGKPKESFILILTGNGCHSYDTPILMYDRTIKKVQDIEVNDKLMGDDNTPRIVQQLFRGVDTMVKIMPKNENSFIVNINHILSLKFDSLISIFLNRDECENNYIIIWYEYNNISEPIKKFKILPTEDLIIPYLKKLYSTKNIIKKGDIIDIKINDLLKWNKSWLNKLFLYKGNKNTNLYSFQLEILENDNYYGFELDKNHRYMTGDNFIHHNSNGKSMMLNIMKDVFGENYCRKIPLAFLTDKRTKSSSAEPALMDLEVARLAHYSESNKNEELNTSKMKEITGQEALSGRNLYEKQKNFRPSCHHVITTNNDFIIETTDNGTWRRIKKYHFKMIFKDNSQEIDENNPYEKKADPKLAMELSTNPSIKEACLSTLVEYYKRLQINYGGCLTNIPTPTINRETEEYRNSQDVINRFINDYIIVSPDSELMLIDLVETYKQWYINNIDNSEIKTANAELGKQLINSKLGKYRKQTKTNTKFIGLRTIESGVPNIEEKEYFISIDKQKEYLQ